MIFKTGHFNLRLLKNDFSLISVLPTCGSKKEHKYSALTSVSNIKYIHVMCTLISIYIYIVLPCEIEGVPVYRCIKFQSAQLH